MQRTVKRALIFNVPSRLVGLAGLIAILIAAPGFAQDVKSKGQLPRLADLMNEVMQVHHTKLWFASHADNWILADYEVRKIKETIEEIKETIVDIQTASAQWQRVPIGEMLTSVDSRLDMLAQAIKAREGTKFETCCHGTGSHQTCKRPLKPVRGPQRRLTPDA